MHSDLSFEDATEVLQDLAVFSGRIKTQIKLNLRQTVNYGKGGTWRRSKLSLHLKKTRQGKVTYTYAATSRNNKKESRYRGQGK